MFCCAVGRVAACRPFLLNSSALSLKFVSSFTQIRQLFHSNSSAVSANLVISFSQIRHLFSRIPFSIAANLFPNCRKTLSQLQKISLSDEARCVCRCSALGWLMKRAAFAIAAQYVFPLSIKQKSGWCGKEFFADGCRGRVERCFQVSAFLLYRHEGMPGGRVNHFAHAAPFLLKFEQKRFSGPLKCLRNVPCEVTLADILPYFVSFEGISWCV